MYSKKDVIYSQPEIVNHLYITGHNLIIDNERGHIQVRDITNLDHIDWEIKQDRFTMSALEVFQNHIFIGKRDRSIEIWNLKERSLESTFKTSTDTPNWITCTKDHTIISGDTSIEIRAKKTLEFMEQDTSSGDVVLNGDVIQMNSPEYQYNSIKHLEDLVLGKLGVKKEKAA